MHDLVSVIIPTFNRAYCLCRAIDSALNQTHPALEVVVIDDGSTDGTKELVQGAYGNDARLKYARQDNRGVSAARNHGLRLAQGDYVAFLDSDDAWKPWKLQVQLAGMRFLPHVGMVWSDMEAIDPNGKVFDRNYLRTMYSAYQWFSESQLFSESHPLSQVAPEMGDTIKDGTLYAGDIFSQMVMGSLVHTSTVVVRRDRVEKVGWFNEEWTCGEDYDFHLRTCREGPVAFVNLAAIQYQRGLTDRLTRHAHLLATNFLKTITVALEKDRTRIKLPQAMLNLALAEAHLWVGMESLNAGDHRSARRHLATSLWYKTRQPHVFSLLALSCLPRKLGQTLRRFYRRLKAPRAEGARLEAA